MFSINGVLFGKVFHIVKAEHVGSETFVLENHVSDLSIPVVTILSPFEVEPEEDFLFGVIIDSEAVVDTDFLLLTADILPREGVAGRGVLSFVETHD